MVELIVESLVVEIILVVQNHVVSEVGLVVGVHRINVVVSPVFHRVEHVPFISLKLFGLGLGFRLTHLLIVEFEHVVVVSHLCIHGLCMVRALDSRVAVRSVQRLNSYLVLSWNLQEILIRLVGP